MRHSVGGKRRVTDLPDEREETLASASIFGVGELKVSREKEGGKERTEPWGQ
jgi:hypothetical protein